MADLLGTQVSAAALLSSGVVKELGCSQEPESGPLSEYWLAAVCGGTSPGERCRMLPRCPRSRWTTALKVCRAFTAEAGTKSTGGATRSREPRNSLARSAGCGS